MTDETGLLPRDSVPDHPRESWRPPLFQSPNTWLTRAAAVLRRGLDLQAASIWNDLSVLLPSCHGSLLDVGCGAQPYRPLLPSATRYQGIDTSEAQQNFGYEVPDTTYFSGSTWPVPDTSVNTVLATETLEHVLHPLPFLKEAQRCLAPGGRLILTVPFAARWHFIPHDYWRFTPSALRHLLSEAGFTDVTVYARGNELTVAGYKCVTLILTWLLGRTEWSAVGLLKKFLALLLLPGLPVAAFAGQLSLRSRGGNDCLGYTVVATKVPPLCPGAA
jgi:SAM-dependent methyltransferase